MPDTEAVKGLLLIRTRQEFLILPLFFFWEVLTTIIWEKELRNIDTGREKYKLFLFENNNTIYLENLPK